MASTRSVRRRLTSHSHLCHARTHAHRHTRTHAIARTHRDTPHTCVHYIHENVAVTDNGALRTALRTDNCNSAPSIRATRIENLYFRCLPAPVAVRASYGTPSYDGPVSCDPQADEERRRHKARLIRNLGGGEFSKQEKL